VVRVKTSNNFGSQYLYMFYIIVHYVNTWPQCRASPNASEL